MASARSRTEVVTVGLVTGGHFLSHFYLIAFPPLFPLLREEFGLSNTQLGIVVSVIAAGMLLQIPVGEVVDRVGAKWILVLGIATTSLGVSLAGLASSYAALVGFAALSGIGQAAFHPADYPLVESVSDADRLGKNFSVHTFGGYLGFTAGPLIVGFLGVAYGWRTALVLVGAVGVCYALVVAALLGPVYRASIDSSDGAASSRTTGSRAALFRPEILVLSAFFVVITMAEKGVQTFSPLVVVDALHLSEAIGNTALSAFFAVTSVAVLAGGVLADRYDPRQVIAVATTTAAATLLLLVSGAIPARAAVVVAAFGVAGGAFGLVFASRDRLVSDHAAEGSTGRSFGFVFTASSVGSLSSPLVLGLVIDASTATLGFALVGGFFLVSGVVVLLIGAARPSLRARISSGD